jgi:hypothetical protein
MEIMYDFIKKHFQGRFYRKSRDVNEFIEDIAEYMLNGQTKKCIQEWEDRLYKTLMLIDPSGSWGRWKTIERIIDLEDMGVHLEVCKEKSAKEIRKDEGKENRARHKEAYKKYGAQYKP